MLSKAWFILRLLIFVLTIQYAAALFRCIPEYLWSVHPSYLLSPSYYEEPQALRKPATTLLVPSFSDSSDLGRLNEWRDAERKRVLSGVQRSKLDGNPCEKLWAKRYGDERFAHTLFVIAKWFLIVWLSSSILCLLDQFFLGTYLVAEFQGWVLGHLWSVYYDTPRHSLLWLLRKVDPAER